MILVYRCICGLVNEKGHFRGRHKTKDTIRTKLFDVFVRIFVNWISVERNHSLTKCWGGAPQINTRGTHDIQYWALPQISKQNKDICVTIPGHKCRRNKAD